MKLRLLCLLLLLSSGTHAQLNLGAMIGKTYGEVTSTIRDRAGTITNVRSSDALPIAEGEMLHYVLEDFALEPGLVIGKIAFTFIDNRLYLIQTRDPRLENYLLPLQKEKPMEYGGHTIYPAYAMSVSQTDSRTSIFAPEHLHVHLFLWENPHVRTEIKRIPRAINLFTMPLGGSMASVMTQFQPRCAMIKKRTIQDSPFPDVDQHVQLDCFGYNYFEFPRKLEMIMINDQLEAIWILIDRAEMEKMKTLLTAKAGGIAKETDQYIWFSDGRTALRKDNPEVLICSEKYLPFFKGS